MYKLLHPDSPDVIQIVRANMFSEDRPKPNRLQIFMQQNIHDQADVLRATTVYI